MSVERQNAAGLVNINTASLKELTEGLSGLGPVLGQRVIDYRQTHGPFAAVGDLARVPGVGPVLVSQNVGRLTVGESTIVYDAEAQMPPGGPQAQVFAVEEPAAESVAAMEDEEAPTEEPSEPAGVETGANAKIKSSQPPEAKGKRPAPEPPPEKPIAPPMMEAPVPERRTERGGFWQHLLLVVLGGLLGVLLTLALVVIWSGTLDFAPRREVEALSRNLEIMQSNNDLTWQRLNQASGRLDELESQVRVLRTLGRRVDTLETDLDLARAGIDNLRGEVQTMRNELGKQLAGLDERVGRTEGNLRELEVALAQTEEKLQAVQVRVQRFDDFLLALRQLLMDLDGTSQPETATEEAAPAATALPTEAITPTVTPTPGR